MFHVHYFLPFLFSSHLPFLLLSSSKDEYTVLCTFQYNNRAEKLYFKFILEIYKERENRVLKSIIEDNSWNPLPTIPTWDEQSK